MMVCTTIDITRNNIDLFIKYDFWTHLHYVTLCTNKLIYLSYFTFRHIPIPYKQAQKEMYAI